ncbi:unnamed protein product [Phaedon cochleariae]|uniref:Protein kinase domain-containing protein n=1 Tax=Phaedon cochleariae TaxID=80249 RepID=A0A9P0GIJ5_PHACE|nr:unnamed protein product [Phaedon cochleariae]
MSTARKELQIKESEDEVLLKKGYKIIKKLGEGSYAPVYFTEYTIKNETARGKSTGEKETVLKLACKIIDTKRAPKDYVKKFLPRELDVMTRMNHPHIVHIQSIFQRKSRYFIFMRMEHTDLLDCILENGPISEGRARLWFRQLVLAVQYLHEMGVAHRDLKCENCLISFNNNLKLADFSFARYVIDGHGKKLTSSTYCGSLNYAAPEVLKGTVYYPKNSDCWSIGVILFAMVNKAMPFEDKNVKNLVDQQLNKKWKFRAKVVDYLSPEIKTLTEHLLEPDPLKRWLTDQAIDSDWIRLDPRLISLTVDEQTCLVQARQLKEIYMEKLRKKTKFEGGVTGETNKVRVEAPAEKTEQEEDGFKVLKRSLTRGGEGSKIYQSRLRV